MNKMTGFLLLILSLMKDFKATSEGKDCTIRGCDAIKIKRESEENFCGGERNSWLIPPCEIDMKNIIQCKEDDQRHQEQFSQTAYSKATTTITCDYPTNDKFNVHFFCKENGATCQEILPTNSSPWSNERFTLRGSNSSANISIRNLSSKDGGVYWCGLKSEFSNQCVKCRKIKLEVKSITNFTRSPTVGQNFTYWCQYPSNAPSEKFICKGEDPSICKPLVNTTKHNVTPERFSMNDDKMNRNITITVRGLTTEDTGTYWCGAERNDQKKSNPFFHKFVMTVVPSPTLSTSSAPSTLSTTASHGYPAGGSEVVVIVIVCVAVLLLFVLIAIIYKRFSHTENTSNEAAAQHIRQEFDQEMQEHAQKPNTGNATDPPASLLYSTINFQNRSDKAAGEAANPGSDSPASEYSTVKYIQSPAPST